MNRRTFIHTAGAAGLGLTSRLGLSEPGGSVDMLLKLLEDSPRERVPRELARLIRDGLRYEDLLVALSLAATRNVQPYPDVGFKYHAVMVLRSIHSTTQALVADEKWLPLVWAVDYFKETQAQERAASGWHMPTPAAAATAATTADAARRALINALDKWDREAADVAIVRYARSASTDEVFSVLFHYGTRDLREIGHKAITVSNAHSLVKLFGNGGQQAEPILRSTVAALVNSEGEPNPATHDLREDRPARLNHERLHQIPRTWKQGHDDPAARADLRAAFYHASADDAGKSVVEMLQRGISADTIWQVLFDTSAELLMHQPGIVSLHSQTSANALHYAYRTAGDEQTQQLALLQSAAFVAMFREMTNTGAGGFNLQKLQPVQLRSAQSQPSQPQPSQSQLSSQPPLPAQPQPAADLQGTAAPALEEIFADLSARRREQAAQKSLAYLQGGGDAGSLIAAARHHLVYGAMEAHDYKFAEAVFDNYAQFPDPQWRARFLSAGMAYFKAPTARPVPIVAETLELLRA